MKKKSIYHLFLEVDTWETLAASLEYSKIQYSVDEPSLGVSRGFITEAPRETHYNFFLITTSLRAWWCHWERGATLGT